MGPICQISGAHMSNVGVLYVHMGLPIFISHGANMRMIWADTYGHAHIQPTWGPYAKYLGRYIPSKHYGTGPLLACSGFVPAVPSSFDGT